ncbi:hypothetical protein L3X38_029162 [Prunus dulcis]|uniref:Uncharacterized protein n=1 Tax=Prunus dulcis TaxID=3755 RepID=A0AAD4VR58_PRUDU|nr:hypothetical protein L3X38_029162 [Prunus dulcis]
MHQQKKLKLLKLSEKVEISLQPFDYELLTVSPSLEFEDEENSSNLVRIGVKGLWGNESVCFRKAKCEKTLLSGVTLQPQPVEIEEQEKKKKKEEEEEEEEEAPMEKEREEKEAPKDKEKEEEEAPR